MSRTLLFTGASEIITATSADESAVLRHAAIAVADADILAVGPAAQVSQRFEHAEHIDCSGQVITPGFIDSHTHAVFGGHRAAEYEMRARGLDYMEIARQGGGINSSVRAVREYDEDQLVALTLLRLEQAFELGTTTIEIKSGYGLSLNDELKLLRVIHTVAQHTPVTVVPTFLGAHDVPVELRDKRDEYIRMVVEEMIPAVAAQQLAVFCDVFLEPGAFTENEARTILTAGAEHGLVAKLHADEFANARGAELAAELGAASADHLGAISEAGIRALAGSQTVATLLPATLFFLGKKNYAPARALIDSGARVALASDFNPGTAPSASMPLVLTMACSQMQMTPLEAIVAATQGGAKALRLTGVGELAAGARADLVVWKVPDHREIPYHFGKPPVAGVWKSGKRLL